MYEGQVIKGQVARLTDFGAFIDLGGIDGLVHVSEISHSHVAKPADVLSVGDEVEVQVLSVDPEKERISLSIKANLPGPWTDIEEKAAPGSVLEGTVKRLTSFGAFVEIAPGKEGLVHISKLADKRVEKVEDVVKVDDLVMVKLLEIFPGVEGLVHISQISHKHIATPHEVLHEGDQVQVKVLEVHPEDHRVALSIKALEEKPEEAKPEPVEEDSYELPEENTGFTMGDILGDALNEDSEEQE